YLDGHACRGHDGDQRPDELGLELAAALALQLLEDPLVRARRLIRPPGAHDVEGVDDGHDAGSERDLIAPQPVGVPTAVEVLVMMLDDEPDVLPRVDVGE